MVAESIGARRRFSIIFLSILFLAGLTAVLVFAYSNRVKTPIEEAKWMYNRFKTGQEVDSERVERFRQLICESSDVRQWVIKSFRDFNELQKLETYYQIKEIARLRNQEFEEFIPLILDSLRIEKIENIELGAALNCLEFYDIPEKKNRLLDFIRVREHLNEHLISLTFRVFVSAYGLDEITELTHTRLRDENLAVGFKTQLAVIILVKCTTCSSAETQFALEP